MPTSASQWTYCATTRRWSTIWPARLVELGDSVPETIASCHVCGPDPFKDDRDLRLSRTTRLRCTLPRARRSPTALRLAKWGAWINTYGQARTTSVPCSSSHLPTWPSPPTSPALPAASPTLQASAAIIATRNTLGAAPAARDHRVHQCRHCRRHGHRQFRRDPFNDFNGFYTGHARPMAHLST